MNETQVVTVEQLLMDYTLLLNRHGVDSMEAIRFLKDHARNAEFTTLAGTARRMKMALSADRDIFDRHRSGGS